MLSILIYDNIIKMSNRQQPQHQRQSPPDIPIFVDNTATIEPLRVNQDNRFILQPIEDNRQAQAIGRYDHNAVPGYPVEGWRLHYTRPSDITSAPVYFAANPGAYATAANTYFPPRGEPIVVDTLAWGYEATGRWHIAHLQDSLGERQQRVDPDVYPLWSRDVLRSLDRVYRHEEVTYTGLMWPTPAIGMTMYLPTIRAVERSGMLIQYLDRDGYVKWIWQGTQ